MKSPLRRTHRLGGNIAISWRVPRIQRLFTVALALIAFVVPARAATDTWTGSTDGTWNTGNNWNTGTVPGASDTGVFNSAGNSNATIDLGAGVAAGNILFDTAGAAAYTIGKGAVNSQTLTLSSAGLITVNPTVTNAQLFNATVNLGTSTGQSFSFINNSATAAAVLNFAGNVVGSTSGSGQNTLTLDGSNVGNLGTGSGTATGVVYNAISGNVSNGTGTLQLVKNGTGTWVLNPAAAGGDAFTGGINLNGGTLIEEGVPVNLTNGLAATLALTGNGGTFGLDSSGLGSGTHSQTFASLAASSGETTIYVARANGGGANLTLGSYSVSAGATVTFAAGSLTSNANTFGGSGITTTLGINGIIRIANITTSGFLGAATFVNNVNNTTAAGGVGYGWYDTTLNGGAGSVRGVNYGTDSGTFTTATTASIASGMGYNEVQTTGAITAQTTNTFVTLNVASISSSSSDNFTLAAGAILTVNGVLYGDPAASSQAYPGGPLFVGTATSGVQAASNQQLVINVASSGTNVQWTAPILANGTNALVKAGAGQLTLSSFAANSTFTGGTYIDAGTIATSANSGATEGVLGLNTNPLQIYGSGTLDVAGTTQTIGNLTMGATGVGGAQALIKNSSTGAAAVLNASSITINGTNNVIGVVGAAKGLTVTGNITQNANSSLAINATASGSDSIAAGAVLSGVGSVGILTLISGGTVSPGNGGTSDTLMSTGALTFNGGATLAFHLSTSSNASSLLNLGVNAFTKGTAGSYNINLTGGSSTPGVVYDLVNFGSTTFASTDFTEIGSLAGIFQILNGDELAFTVAAVPEPSTWAMVIVLASLVLLPAVRRHRRGLTLV